jgi:hypothetical protein
MNIMATVFFDAGVIGHCAESGVRAGAIRNFLAQTN